MDAGIAVDSYRVNGCVPVAVVGVWQLCSQILDVVTGGPGHACRLQQARPGSDPGHHRRSREPTLDPHPDDVSYRGALRSKLLEEAQEAEAAPDEQLASELADVLEVLRALATAYGITWEDIKVQAEHKRAERGGFDRRIFLEHVDQAP